MAFGVSTLRTLLFRGISCGTESNARDQRERKSVVGRGRSSHIAPEGLPSSPSEESVRQSQWVSLPFELLVDIIGRVEGTQTSWPARRDVIACASVCRSWREATKQVVRTPEQCALLTFPISLKQPGPRDQPIQCFIRRDRASSTFWLYLGLSPALSGNASKLLFAAKRVRKATKTEFLISLAADDFSGSNDNYVGKLRSNFLGTKFIVYDSMPPCNSSAYAGGQSYGKCASKKMSSRLPAGKYAVASISYKLNVLRTRGPRRMQCTMNMIPMSAVEEGGIAPTMDTFGYHPADKIATPVVKGKTQASDSVSLTDSAESPFEDKHPLVLRNKAPRWHAQLQCWCLNFKGRVTVASVKNFQLVVAFDQLEAVSAEEQDRVIVQFGKIGKDIFTMDYCYPLSAFQAFAICLSSFDTKPACE